MVDGGSRTGTGHGCGTIEEGRVGRWVSSVVVVPVGCSSRAGRFGQTGLVRRTSKCR